MHEKCEKCVHREHDLEHYVPGCGYRYPDCYEAVGFPDFEPKEEPEIEKNQKTEVEEDLEDACKKTFPMYIGDITLEPKKIEKEEKTVKCKKCKTDMPQEALYCPQCGEKVKKKVKKCYLDTTWSFLAGVALVAIGILCYIGIFSYLAAAVSTVPVAGITLSLLSIRTKEVDKISLKEKIKAWKGKRMDKRIAKLKEDLEMMSLELVKETTRADSLKKMGEDLVDDYDARGREIVDLKKDRAENYVKLENKVTDQIIEYEIKQDACDVAIVTLKAFIPNKRFGWPGNWAIFSKKDLKKPITRDDI